jgi:hypothetical protein
MFSSPSTFFDLAQRCDFLPARMPIAWPTAPPLSVGEPTVICFNQLGS